MTRATCYVTIRALALSHVLAVYETTGLIKSDLVLRHFHSTIRALTDLQLNTDEIKIVLREAEDKWRESRTDVAWPYPSVVEKEAKRMDFETVGVSSDDDDEGDA